jgi:hypothetical protein
LYQGKKRDTPDHNLINFSGGKRREEIWRGGEKENENRGEKISQGKKRVTKGKVCNRRENKTRELSRRKENGKEVKEI